MTNSTIKIMYLYFNKNRT